MNEQETTSIYYRIIFFFFPFLFFNTMKSNANEAQKEGRKGGMAERKKKI